MRWFRLPITLASFLLAKIRSFFSWYWKLSWKKRIILAIIIFVMLFYIWRSVTKKGTTYTTDTVKRDTVVEEVSETGNLHGAGVVSVTSPATGIVQSLLVANGDAVHKGDTLFTVTSTATEKEKAAAYADYTAAKTALGTVQATQYSYQSTMFTKWKTFRDIAQSSTFENDDGSPKSNERTLPEFHTAEDDWLAAEAQYKNQTQAVAQAQAAVTNTSLAYQATQNATVIAPIDGIVSNLGAVVGDDIKASTTTNQTPILLLSTGQQYSVKIQVNEVDINKVALGQTATISFDAIKNTTYTGQVMAIDSIGTNTSGVITYGVLITVNAPDAALKSEMTAQVSIETARHPDVLTVANSAVKPFQGGKGVQVIRQQANGKQSTPEYVKVKTGIKGPLRTEITEGVSEGMLVVTGTLTPASTGGLFSRGTTPTPTIASK